MSNTSVINGNDQELSNKSINSVATECISNLSPEAKALLRKLAQNGIKITDSTTKEDIIRDFSYLEEAVTLARGGNGLQYEMIDYNQFGDRKTFKKYYSKPEDIYLKLKEIKSEELRREIAQKEKQAREDRDYEAWYYNRQADIAKSESRGELSSYQNYTIATPQEAREKRFACQYCSSRFDNQQDQKIHSRSHMLYMR